MTITDPAETPESSFEIEEGSLSSQFPRPNWEMLSGVAGAILIGAGFCLPWMTIQGQGGGPDGPPAATTVISGWMYATASFSRQPSDVLTSYMTLLLIGIPVLAAVVALYVNALWYRKRLTPFLCGISLAAIFIGAFVLFAESFFLIVEITGAAGGQGAAAGPGMPLMFFGYFALAASSFTMNLTYWRQQGQAETGN
jgi:hypothetical protein